MPVTVSIFRVIAMNLCLSPSLDSQFSLIVFVISPWFPVWCQYFGVLQPMNVRDPGKGQKPKRHSATHELYAKDHAHNFLSSSTTVKSFEHGVPVISKDMLGMDAY